MMRLLSSLLVLLISLASVFAEDTPSYTDEDFRKMRTKELREFLAARGQACNGCAEKADWVNMAKQYRDVEPLPKEEEKKEDETKDEGEEAAEKEKEKGAEKAEDEEVAPESDAAADSESEEGDATDTAEKADGDDTAEDAKEEEHGDKKDKGKKSKAQDKKKKNNKKNKKKDGKKKKNQKAKKDKTDESGDGTSAFAKTWANQGHKICMQTADKIAKKKLKMDRPDKDEAVPETETDAETKSTDGEQDASASASEEGGDAKEKKEEEAGDTAEGGDMKGDADITDDASVAKERKEKKQVLKKQSEQACGMLRASIADSFEMYGGGMFASILGNKPVNVKALSLKKPYKAAGLRLVKRATKKALDLYEKSLESPQEGDASEEKEPEKKQEQEQEQQQEQQNNEEQKTDSAGGDEADTPTTESEGEAKEGGVEQEHISDDAEKKPKTAQEEIKLMVSSEFTGWLLDLQMEKPDRMQFHGAGMDDWMKDDDFDFGKKEKKDKKKKKKSTPPEPTHESKSREEKKRDKRYLENLNKFAKPSRKTDEPTLKTKYKYERVEPPHINKMRRRRRLLEETEETEDPMIHLEL